MYPWPPLAYWSGVTIGLRENVSKRQVWPAADGGSAVVEHLGLSVDALSGELPCLRNGWAPILEVLPLLARLAGGLLTREAAVRTFLKGKWFWAFPCSSRLLLTLSLLFGALF